MILLYICEITSSDSLSHPETTLTILLSVCCLSPGLIRSGEYPILKSIGHERPLCCSRMGRQISSVTPGYTVDSKTTILPFDRCSPTTLHAPLSKVRSGSCRLSIGVG